MKRLLEAGSYLCLAISIAGSAVAQGAGDSELPTPTLEETIGLIMDLYGMNDSSQGGVNSLEIEPTGEIVYEHKEWVRQRRFLIQDVGEIAFMPAERETSSNYVEFTCRIGKTEEPTSCIRRQEDPDSDKYAGVGIHSFDESIIIYFNIWGDDGEMVENAFQHLKTVVPQKHQSGLERFFLQGE